MNKTLLTLLVLGVSGSALAAMEDRGFYIGTGAGEADADDTPELGLTDDTQTAFRLFGGYDFSRYLAAEAGYLDFGTYHGSIPTIEAFAHTRLKLDGFTLGLRPQIALGHDWFAQAQVGAFLWDSKYRLTSPNHTFNDKDNGADAYYGVGVGRNFGPAWRLSGEWTRFETDSSDVDFLNVGMSYRFGK